MIEEIMRPWLLVSSESSLIMESLRLLFLSVSLAVLDDRATFRLLYGIIRMSCIRGGCISLTGRLVYPKSSRLGLYTMDSEHHEVAYGCNVVSFH